MLMEKDVTAAINHHIEVTVDHDVEKVKQGYEKCISRSILLPTTLDQVFHEQEKTETLHRMFDDVHFTFPEGKEQIEQDMQYNARGLDEDEAAYQFKSVVTNELIAAQLIDPERAQKKIYFEEMKFQFDFIQEENQTRLRLTMRYNPKHNLTTFFMGTMVDINKEAPKVLEAALKRLYRTVFSPHAFTIATSIHESIEKSKKDGMHVIKSSCPVSATPEKIYTHINDLKNCHLIHPRLKYNGNEGTITQDLIISSVKHTIMVDEEKREITLRSNTGAAIFSEIKETFQIISTDDPQKTICQMQIEYNYKGWKMGNMIGDKTMDDKVAMLFEKMIVTSLRHIALDAPPVHAPVSELEEDKTEAPSFA